MRQIVLFLAILLSFSSCRRVTENDRPIAKINGVKIEKNLLQSTDSKTPVEYYVTDTKDCFLGGKLQDGDTVYVYNHPSGLKGSKLKAEDKLAVKRFFKETNWLLQTDFSDIWWLIVWIDILICAVLCCCLPKYQKWFILGYILILFITAPMRKVLGNIEYMTSGIVTNLENNVVYLDNGTAYKLASLTDIYFRTEVQKDDRVYLYTDEDLIFPSVVELNKHALNPIAINVKSFWLLLADLLVGMIIGKGIKYLLQYLKKQK